MIRVLVHISVISVLTGALVVWTWFDNEVNRGVTYEPPVTPIAWTDVPQIGVNAFNLQFEPDVADVTRTLELARDMGARFVRIQMPWDDVEIHGKGDFVDRRNPDRVRSSWEKYDIIVQEAQRLGLELIVRIDRAPVWARPSDNADPRFQAGLAEHASSTGPPENYADYADFVAAVAARYRGQVRFIQIWNEPNLAYEWSWRTPEPERFVELLRMAARCSAHCQSRRGDPVSQPLANRREGATHCADERTGVSRPCIPRWRHAILRYHVGAGVWSGSTARREPLYPVALATGCTFPRSGPTDRFADRCFARRDAAGGDGTSR
jgi:hypothetical protein